MMAIIPIVLLSIAGLLVILLFAWQSYQQNRFGLEPTPPIQWNKYRAFGYGPAIYYGSVGKRLVASIAWNPFSGVYECDGDVFHLLDEAKSFCVEKLKKEAQ